MIICRNSQKEINTELMQTRPNGVQPGGHNNH